jgi:hypothetical protein
MCTMLISVEPAAEVPVLLAFARDEVQGRDWKLPARHWPATPDLVGGLDLLAGGTWLAVRPGDVGVPPRAACLLNGFGRPADAERRVSRGRLPLLAAAGEPIERVELPRYDPFHLVVATVDDVSILSWNGAELTGRGLGAGAHLIANSGLEERTADPAAPEHARALIEARAAHFRPRLEAVRRPAPGRTGDTASAWGDWLRLADGDGLDVTDPRALVARRVWEDGHTWHTSSVSLLALSAAGVRYDINPTPGSAGWLQVELAAAPTGPAR